MLAAEETAVCRKGRGVRSSKHMVFGAVYQLGFGNGGTAPEQEHQSRAAFREVAYNAVGEGLPAMSGVRESLMGAHCERGVEEEHPLVGPAREGAAGEGYVQTQVGVYLLEDIHQRRRTRHPLRHGETESVRLAVVVVGILAQNHHLDLVKRGVPESREDVLARRETLVLAAFLDQKILEPCEILRLEIGA